MNSEWNFVNFKLDLLSQNSFKVVEEKHEEYFINILEIKTGFNANKLPTPEYRSILVKSFSQSDSKFIFSSHDVLSALCTIITQLSFDLELCVNVNE